jgi:negative regulator of replication initiation
MRTIRISDEVWTAMAKHGKFGETPDDVFRRILKIETADVSIKGTQPKTGKIDFVDSLLIAKNGNRKTKAEIIELYRKEFPGVLETTARNTVNWCASTLKNRKGIDRNHIP